MALSRTDTYQQKQGVSQKPRNPDKLSKDARLISDLNVKNAVKKEQMEAED